MAMRGGYIWKRFCSLIIPYVSWTLILLWSQGRYEDNYWFLAALFVIIVIAVCVNVMMSRLCSRGCIRNELYCIFVEVLLIGIAIAGCIVLLITTKQRVFRQVIIYSVPFFLGVFLKKYKGVENLIRNRWVYTACLLLYCILVPHYDMENKDVGVLAIRFVTGVLFTIVLYDYSSINIEVIKKYRVFQVIVLLGQNSLGIYIFQEFFRPLFVNQLSGNLFYDTIFRAAAALIICVFSLFLTQLISVSPLLGFLFFGKKGKTQQKLDK